MASLPVCVVGMHRSGTSLAADVLTRLGVHLGPPENALATAPRPHYGYWENSSMVDLNHEVLLALGGASWAPPPLRPGWESESKLDELAERGRALIDEQFATAPRWGFKNPSTTLVLPFWWRVAGSFDHVVCVRSPAGCAASLAARDPSGPLTRADWGAVWLHYYALLLQYLRGKRATWLFFEEWPNHAAEQTAALAEHAGGGTRQEAEIQRIAAAFSPDLQHHMTDRSEAIADPSVPVEATSLWVAMRSAHGRGAGPAELEDGLADLALRLWARVDPRSAGAWAGDSQSATPSRRPPRVSVVLPVRNPDPELLRATVANAVGQDIHDLELVVVDDGSRNGSLEGVAELDWRVRVLRHRVPRGLAAARWSGRRAAAGELVVDLALGERWERDRLRGLVDGTRR